MTALPSVEDLPISGLKLIQLDLRSDQRGWFTETWQSVKFAKLGILNFFPIQANVSSSEELGTTRGLHAEPWGKLVTITSGSAFGAWVDLRKGTEFGKTFFLDLTPGMSIFIPAGIANGFQATSPSTTYSYLIDGHWSENACYKMLNAFDSQLSIPWPISLSNATMSTKDALLDSLTNVTAVKPRPILLLGSNGQVGKELFRQFPGAYRASRQELMAAFDNCTLEQLVPYGGVILNAAAFTNVEESETNEGYKRAIKVNYHLVQRLAEAANAKLATLVHFSTDYVFDGEKQSPYTETDLPSPINKYGISKLLGDLAAQTAKRHYIFRTSWVYGDGENFVKMIAKKAHSGESVKVVSDQRGRPTFSRSLAFAVAQHLSLDTPFGTYNITDSGKETTRHEMAVAIFKNLGADPNLVLPIDSSQFAALKSSNVSRPKNSSLMTSKSFEVGVGGLKEWGLSVNRCLKLIDKGEII